MTEPSLGRQLPFYVGRYRCEEYLGGGMADVYRARDSELPRDVAIKILKPENRTDEEARRSFVEEAQLASQCCHENIVATYDKGDYDGSPFIVMEFLRGQSLRAIIRKREVGDLNRILRIALQIAQGLECVHQQNIIHRDLKPDNVNVDANGRVKLVDFGIAKQAEWNRTQAGLTKGTASYMAPEQVMGEGVSFRTDIWAFGVLLYELLTAGQRPFQAETISDLWGAIMNRPVDPAPLQQAGVPLPIQQMVERCLQKSSANRYPDFGVIARELEGYLNMQDLGVKTKVFTPAPTTPEAVEPAKPGRPAWVLPAAGAAVLLVAVSVYALIASRPKPLEPTLNFPKSGNMVLVAAGKALLGQEKRPVDVAAFYIDQTEVSNAAYSAFLKETGHARPENFREDKPEDPVVNVSFYDAQAFAKWAGKRLPTQQEWEKAARGSDALAFPWGNTPDQRRANVDDNPDLGTERKPLPVRSFPQGASPVGALNMFGNVWEWVDQRTVPEAAIIESFRDVDGLPYKPTKDDTFYSMRGGAYDVKLTPELMWDSAPFPAAFGHLNIGFRCAKTPGTR